MPFTPDPDSPAAVRIAVKAVPGSRRDAVAGRLGDRLKVKVAAPPEDGKANEAIRRLLAAELGVRVAAVRIVSGFAHAEKVVRIEGVTAEQCAAKW